MNGARSIVASPRSGWPAQSIISRVSGVPARWLARHQGVATMIRTETLRQHVAALFGALLVSTLLLSVAAPVISA